jgi:hypothetical protein
MATEKEKALVGEITNLAMEMGAGDYNTCVDYHGHVHGVDVRIALKGSSDWVYYSDTVYLSGRTATWTEKTSVPQLKAMLKQVKKHHPQYDADGVRV